MFTLTYNGMTFQVHEFDAYESSRLLPYPKNYHEVQEGEEFDFEMMSKVTDKEGNQYWAFWIFSDIKGQEKDLGQFDYSYPDKMEIILD